MFDKKLRATIQKHLEADTKHSKSGTKGAITKLINAASETDILLIPAVLQEFEDLPNWLKLRFQKGSLYEEGNRVFGWHREEQVQAEHLPVVLNWFSYDDGEKNRLVKYIEVVSEEMGFAPAVNLPLDGFRVDVSLDSDNFWELLGVGYASPCDLQWSWFERPRWSDLEGYVVERSIIPYGFWKAWKWWPDCWRWYYDKRPELFDDAKWWPESSSVRHSPPDDPYAAVLGGANKQYFKDRMIYCDD